MVSKAGSEMWSRYERGELVPEFVAGEGGSAEPDPEDELASQIAEATGIPSDVARARGRRLSSGHVREEPRRSKRDAPARPPTLRRRACRNARAAPAPV